MTPDNRLDGHGVILGTCPAIGKTQGPVQLAGVCFTVCSPGVRELKDGIARYPAPWILLCADVPESKARQLWYLAFSMRPAARLIVQGPPDDVSRSERWLRRGCAVYVSTRIRRAALEEVLRASIQLDVSLIGHEFQIRGPGGPATTLTDREAGILQLVSEGLRNGEIAGRVGLSENTIEFHVGRVLDKLGARNRVQATATAIRSGVI